MVFLSRNSPRQRELRKLSEIVLFNQSLTGSFLQECKESVLSMLSVRFKDSTVMTPTRLGVFFLFCGGHCWTSQDIDEWNPFHISATKIETPKRTASRFSWFHTPLLIHSIFMHPERMHEWTWTAVGWAQFFQAAALQSLWTRVSHMGWALAPLAAGDWIWWN